MVQLLIWRLLTLVCWQLTCWPLPSCSAFAYNIEELANTTAIFQDNRLEVAFLVPLQLQLTMRDRNAIDYARATALLMELIGSRCNQVQRVFHLDIAFKGYVLSDSRRFSVEGDTFSLYYHVTYLGISKMPAVNLAMNNNCLNKRGTNSYCSEINLDTVMMFNTLLLSSFRFLPKSSSQLSAVFKEFESNSSGYVAAMNTEQHSANYLLCNHFLGCGPNECDLAKITFSNETQRTMDVNTTMDILDLNLAFTSNFYENGTEIPMNLTVYDISKVIARDTGVFRAWCKSPTKNSASSAHHLLPLYAIAVLTGLKFVICSLLFTC